MDRWDRLNVALLLHVAAVVLAPIAIGGVHTATALGLAGASLVALLLQLSWRHAQGFGFRLPALGWVLVAALGLTALQLLPLPPTIVALLSPHAAELRNGAAELAGAGSPGWAPLSLAPAATLVEATRLLAAVASFVGISGIVRIRPERARTTLSALVWGVVLLVVVAVVQQLAGAEALLGFYVPESTSARAFFRATLVNQNHFAALLCLAAPAALGLALDRRTPARRARMFLVAFAVLTGSVFLTLSRVGAIVILVELAAFGVVWFRVRHTWETPRKLGGLGERPGVPVGVALLIVTAAVLVVALPRVAGEWDHLVATGLAGMPKIQSWGDVWRAALAFPATGIGPGAFAEVFPGYNTTMPHHTLYYAENGALQTLVDFGLVAGGALLVTGSGALIALLRRATARPLTLGAGVGAAGVLLENLGDFSLALPGVALPTAAALAVVSALKMPRADARSGSTAWLVGAGIGLLALAPVAWLASEHGAEASRERVARGDAGTLTEAVRWHPADHVLALAAARRSELDSGDVPAARPWYERARTLAPAAFWPALHGLRTALAVGDEAEARDTIDVLVRHHWEHRKTRRTVLELVRDRPELTELVGDALGWHPEDVRAAADELRALGGFAAAQSLLRGGLERRPENVTLLYALGDLYTRRGENAAADRIATRLMGSYPDRVEGFLLHGRLALARGDLALADSLLRGAVERTSKGLEARFLLADVLVRRAEWADLEPLLGQLAAQPLTTRERARLLDLRARAAEGQGHMTDALRHARAAHGALPQHPPYVRHLARLLSELEREDEAKTLWRALLKLRPGDSEALQQLK